MQNRIDVTFSGRVQGVGFRYTTRTIAARFTVSGFVQNLDDGRVRIVVEGESEEVDRMLVAVEERMGDFIRDTQVDRQPVTGEFVSFEIREGGI